MVSRELERFAMKVRSELNDLYRLVNERLKLYDAENRGWRKFLELNFGELLRERGGKVTEIYVTQKEFRTTINPLVNLATLVDEEISREEIEALF